MQKETIMKQLEKQARYAQRSLSRDLLIRHMDRLVWRASWRQ